MHLFMKKQLINITILLIIFSIVSCSGTQTGDSDAQISDKERLILRLPNTINNINYIDLESCRSSEFINELVLDEYEKEGIQMPFSNMEYICMAREDIVNDSASEADGASETGGTSDSAGEADDTGRPVRISGNVNFMMIVKGHFSVDELRSRYDFVNKFTNPITYDGVDGLQNESRTILFVEENMFIIANNDFVEKAMDSFLHGNNTLNSDSRIYKLFLDLMDNDMWAISNLESLGKIDLKKYIPLIPLETTFSYVSAGISVRDNVHDISTYAEVENTEHAKMISTTINSLVSISKSIIKNQIKPVFSEESVEDVKNIVNNFEIKQEENRLYNHISILESTLKEFYMISKQLNIDHIIK